MAQTPVEKPRETAGSRQPSGLPSRSQQRKSSESNTRQEQPEEDISGIRDQLLQSRDFESFSVPQLIAVRQSLPQCIQTCVSNNDFAGAKDYRQFGLDLQAALQGQVKVLRDYRSQQMSQTSRQSSLPTLNPLFVSPEFRAKFGFGIT
jgi:hypothetical protein